MKYPRSRVYRRRPQLRYAIALASATVIAAVSLLALPSADAATVDTAAWYQLVNRNSGKALAVLDDSTADGADIVQWTSNASALDQQWQFVDSGSGYYRLKARHSAKVADVSAKSTADGADVVQWKDNGGSNQQWSIVDTSSGYLKLLNRNSGKALDVSGRSTADGGDVIQWTDNGGTNQQWQLVRVGSTPTSSAPVPSPSADSVPPPSLPSQCSGSSPVVCHFPVQPGNYDVSVAFGGNTAGSTTMTVEARRQILSPVGTAAGTLTRYTVTVNVRQPEGEPTGEGGTGTPGLDITFAGSAPRVNSLSVASASSPRVIYLAGDSTVCDQPIAPYTGWGQILPTYVKGGAAVANYADAGESSGSFLSNSVLFPAIRAAVKPGDIVLIQFGHNDKTTTAAAYKNNLTTMVTQVKAAGGQPVLVTPPVRRQFSGNQLTPTALHVNSLGVDLPAAMREVAAAQNVPLIDLTAKSKTLVESLGPSASQAIYLTAATDGVSDDTHFSAYGAGQMAALVVQGAREQNLPLVQYLR